LSSFRLFSPLFFFREAPYRLFPFLFSTSKGVFTVTDPFPFFEEVPPPRGNFLPPQASWVSVLFSRACFLPFSPSPHWKGSLPPEVLALALSFSPCFNRPFFFFFPQKRPCTSSLFSERSNFFFFLFFRGAFLFFFSARTVLQAGWLFLRSDSFSLVLEEFSVISLSSYIFPFFFFFSSSLW